MHRRLLAVLAATTLACSTPREEVRATESAPRLAAADSSFTPGVGTAVVELPEAGGFLVDGQPASQDSIPVLLAARFAAAGEHQRLVLVRDNPARRVDAQWIARAALGAGGRAFDYELSGSPVPTPPSGQ